jgi:predicted RecB family nuclease
MRLTSDLINAFVHCHYKAYLKSVGDPGSPTEYELLEERHAKAYQEKAIRRISEHYSASDVASGPLSLDEIRQCRHRLHLNVSVSDDHHSMVFPAIEHVADGRKHDYAVLTFSPTNKVSKFIRLLAGLLGMAFKRWADLPVSCVKVIFGCQFSTKRLVLFNTDGPTHLGNEATSMLRDLEALLLMPAPPRLYLNAHCAVCEYRERCRKDAIEKDDLSLLTGLPQKEIDAWKERGIFTVTQLAHTFRPKTMGRSSVQPKRHSQQLQAMAIRDKTTYVRKRPEMPVAATRVFLDVEGIPDSGLFYLIWVVIVRGEEQVHYQF